MTDKRDLKRRVRARQDKTGESYATARRHVLAARSPGEPATAVTATAATATAARHPIPVDELLDISESAAALGLRCRVLVVTALVEQLDPMRATAALRDALVAMAGDPATEPLRGVALRGEAPPPSDRLGVRDHIRFLAGVRAGVGGVSPDRRTLAVHVGGTVVVCGVWRNEATLVLSTIDGGLAAVARLGGQRFARR